MQQRASQFDGRARRLEHLTREEVEGSIADGWGIVLPVGSIEQHGPRLPLGVDAFIAHELAQRVGQACRVVVAPPVFYAGYSRPRTGGGRHFVGSTGVSDRTLERLVTEIVGDWLRQGFRYVMVLNGHYENGSALLAAVERAVGYPVDGPARVALCSWWDAVNDDELRAIFGADLGSIAQEHAGVLETSIMEAVHSDLIRSSERPAGGAKRTVWYDVLPPPADTLWPNGVGSTAVGSSATKGEALLELVVARLADVIVTEFGDHSEV